jgi:hypothetical protein
VAGVKNGPSDVAGFFLLAGCMILKLSKIIFSLLKVMK